MSKMEKENVFDFIRNSVALSVWEIGCMRAVSLSLIALAVKTFRYYVKNGERKRL